MKHVAFLVGLFAFTSSAASEDFPPFTMKFEAALQAYGKCIREAVDRYDLNVTSAQVAAGGAINVCEASYQATEAQLADDFATRRGYSLKSARRSAFNRPA